MANEDIYVEYLNKGMCVEHSELEIGGIYEFTYYDAYIGELIAMTLDREYLKLRITQVCDKDYAPAYGVGDTLQVFDINIKKRIVPQPALVLGGLDPLEYPEVVAKCGCKSIDGTVTDMCEAHEIDMHRGK